MTLREALAKAEAALAVRREELRSRSEIEWRDQGASEDEIAALQAHSDAMWAQDKISQLRKLRRELESWLIRGGDAVLH